jgi:Lysozyme like domain
MPGIPMGLMALGAGLGQAVKSWQEQQRQQQNQQQQQIQRQLQMMQLQNAVKQQQTDAAMGQLDFAGIGQVGGDTSGGGGVGTPVSQMFPQAPATDPTPSLGGGGGGGMKAGGGLSLGNLTQLARQAGFSPDKAPTMAAISMAESTHLPDGTADPNSYNPNDPDGGSFGVTQINGVHPGAQSARGNPARAMQLAYQVSNGGTNFRPWTTYTSGKYKSYLRPGGTGQDRTSPAMPGAQMTGSSAAPDGSGWSSPQGDWGSAAANSTLGGQGGGGGPQMAQAGAPQTAEQVIQMMAPDAHSKAQLLALKNNIARIKQPNGQPLDMAQREKLLVEKWKQIRPEEAEYAREWMAQKRSDHSDLVHQRTQEHSDAVRGQQQERADVHLQEGRAFTEGQANKRAENVNWDLMTDDSNGQQYYVQRGHPETAKDAKTGKPYTIGGGVRKGGEGGAGGSASAGREADVAKEIKRLDDQYATDHPGATTSDKSAAHFKNREAAEKSMTAAKTSGSRASPTNIVMRKLIDEHPEWGGEDYLRAANKITAQQSIERRYGGGMGATQMTQLNTVADHLKLMREYAGALRNGDTPFTEIPRLNQVIQALAKERGLPEVTNFNIARDIMADEVVRLLTSTGGTEQDRIGMQANLKAMMSSYQQDGSLEAFEKFTAGRFKGLEQGYSRNDPQRIADFRNTMMTPEARDIFLKYEQAGGTTQSGPGGGAAPPKPGEIRKGFRFKGGDPADQKSWEPTQSPGPGGA